MWLIHEEAEAMEGWKKLLEAEAPACGRVCRVEAYGKPRGSHTLVVIVAEPVDRPGAGMHAAALTDPRRVGRIAEKAGEDPEEAIRRIALEDLVAAEGPIEKLSYYGFLDPAKRSGVGFIHAPGRMLVIYKPEYLDELLSCPAAGWLEPAKRKRNELEKGGRSKGLLILTGK